MKLTHISIINNEIDLHFTNGHLIMIPTSNSVSDHDTNLNFTHSYLILIQNNLSN